MRAYPAPMMSCAQMAVSARVPAQEKRRVGRMRRVVQRGAPDRMACGDGWDLTSDKRVLSDRSHTRRPRRFGVLSE